MKQTKIFTPHEIYNALSVNEFSPELNIATYFFSVLWERGPRILVIQLEAQLNNAGEWIPVITKTVMDNDGEISIQIGHLNIGTKLSLRFSVTAIDAVTNASVWLTNKEARQSRKLEPADPHEYKPIDAGTTWSKIISDITLF